MSATTMQCWVIGDVQITKIIEVEGHTVMSFLGGIPTHPVGEPHAETAFRTILFTDIVGSTDATQRLGDAKAMEDTIAACRKGSYAARVDGIEIRDGHEDELALRGNDKFAVLPTV